MEWNARSEKKIETIMEKKTKMHKNLSRNGIKIAQVPKLKK